MARLELIYSPDPLLKRKSQEVGEVTDNIRQFIDDMIQTMHDRNGIGLAAVQVGILKNILVMDLSRGSGRYPEEEKGGSEPICMINPKIIKKSEEKNTYEEGCLSFPSQYAKVIRPKQVIVEYLDYDGQKQELSCDELLATCVQHEIDHLNGITFIDHISRIKRNIILKKLAKQQKNIDDEKSTHDTQGNLTL